jgi:6,7-dimethyl-8-ribityllumazine synthase
MSGASRDRRFAFIQSSWHKDLVDQCRTTFVAELEQLGVPAA